MFEWGATDAEKAQIERDRVARQQRRVDRRNAKKAAKAERKENK